MVEPDASSTPKIVPLTRRRPIGDNNDSVQSPINICTRKSSIEKDNYLKSYSTDEEIDGRIESDDEGISRSEEIATNTQWCNCLRFRDIIIAAIIAIFLVLLVYMPEKQNEVVAVSLSEEFPSQVDDFWIYVEEGIKDIKRYQKPKTLMLLFNNKSETTLKNIINRIGQFATCALTNCEVLPITLEAYDLQSGDILEDYGNIISRNKKRLQETGVMIVNNLENVPGTSAQAFHSFCDEYYPLVENALFIFTLKVDKPRGDKSYVEKYLRERWKNLDDDKFYPLFTRITGVILPVVAED